MGKIKVVEFEQELTRTIKTKIGLGDIQKYIPSIDLVYTQSKFEELDKQREDCERRQANNQICYKAVEEIIKDVFNPSTLIYRSMGVKVELITTSPSNVVFINGKWVMNVNISRLVCKKYGIDATFFVWSNREIPKNTDDILIKTGYAGEDRSLQNIFNKGNSQPDGTFIQTLGSLLTDIRDFILDDYKNNIETYTNNLYKEQNV